MGMSLHREDGSGAPGVQSALKVLVEIQKHINIVFLKDVELAASFAVESSKKRDPRERVASLGAEVKRRERARELLINLR